MSTGNQADDARPAQPAQQVRDQPGQDQPAQPAQVKLTKKSLLGQLTSSTGLTKPQVNRVLDGLKAILVAELKINGVVTLPGLLKLRVAQKGPTPERESINPATRQPMTVPAKPARKTLKSTPLKALKDLVV